MVMMSSQSSIVMGPQLPDEVPKSPEEIWIENTIESLTLPEKIGQLIITGLDGENLKDDEELMINSQQVGGIIFLGHNVKKEVQFLELRNSIPKTEIPLFMAIDQEGGRVQRLPMNRSDFPSALNMGETPEKAYAYGEQIGEALLNFNMNMNFAPVLDVFSNPYNKVIGNRAYGRSPERVATVGVDVMKGMQSTGIITSVKHFPGHGDTSMDSHEGLPVVTHKLERLLSFEWIPFKAAIESGADMVMTAHILLPEIDPEYPATMSKVIITEHLRGTLGFEGVVITDDLVMGAISKKYPYETAVLKAVEAGVDILLISNNDYVDEIQHALYRAVQNGTIEESRIDDSLKRILALKYKYLVAKN